MFAKKYYRLTGKVQDKPYFELNEYNNMDFDLIHRILMGDKLGAMFRNCINSAERETVVNNFWTSETIKNRCDGVPALTVGAYHYKKSLNDYLDQVEDLKESTDSLFNGTNKFVDILLEDLRLYFSRKNITFRIARHNDRDAAKFILRSCHSESEYVIKPHDDVAQCRTQIQRGFEIENIPNYQMIAVNMCLENNNDGKLHIWDIQPDDAARQYLEISETGYPYPPYLVHEFDEIVIPIRAGDIYCFNGRNIHAVKSGIKSKLFRTTITFFMGYIDSKTIIYWT